MLDIENHKMIRETLKWEMCGSMVPLKGLNDKKLLEVKATLDDKKKFLAPVLHEVSSDMINEVLESVNNEIEFRMYNIFEKC